MYEGDVHMCVDLVRSGRMGKNLALSHDARIMLCSVRAS